MERDALKLAGNITSENPSEVLVSTLLRKGQSLEEEEEEEEGGGGRKMTTAGKNFCMSR